MNKISHQNNIVVCYQHLFSCQCKAQRNWRQRIFLGANKNINKKLFFLCVLDTEWNMLDYLQSKNHECIVLIHLAKQSYFPYILHLELPHSRDIQQFPLRLLLVCSFLHLPRLSWGMRDALHFSETSGCAVLSVVSWGMVGLGFWTAAQGRPRLTMHQPWNSFHYTVGISPEAGQLSI